MNWLDIVILVVIAGSIFSGFTSGLVRMAFGLAGFVAGIFLAGQYYLDVAGYLGFIPSAVVARVVAFLVIMGVAGAVANILGGMLAKGMRFLPFGGCFDRLAGGVLGLATGLSIATVGVALLARLPLSALEAAAKESAVAPYLLDYLPFLLALLPEEFAGIRSFF